MRGSPGSDISGCPFGVICIFGHSSSEQRANLLMRQECESVTSVAYVPSLRKLLVERGPSFD